MPNQTEPLAPAIVEEGRTLRQLPNGGWDERIAIAECDKLVRSFLIVSQRYVLLHDTMLGPACGQWLKNWAQAQLGGRQLLVFSSHADWDHYWGNQVFDCPILGSTLSVERVKSTSGPQELARKRSEFPAAYESVRPTAPTVLFAQGGVIDGGDLTFHLQPTPGHRHDHLSLWIPELSTLFPADSVEDPFPLFDEAGGSAVIEQERHTLGSHLALNPAWVMPCHAEPQKGQQLLKSNLAYVEQLIRMAGEAQAQKLGIEGLRGLFPNPFPDAAAFYGEEHERALQLGLGDAYRQG